MIESTLMQQYQQINSNDNHQVNQSQPRQPNQPKNSSNTNHSNPSRHRLIYEASNLFENNNNHNNNITQKLKNTTKENSNEIIAISNNEIPKKIVNKHTYDHHQQNYNHNQQRKNESTPNFTSILPLEPQPQIHLSKEDVKTARKLLKGILQCTENILVQSKDDIN